MNRPLLACGSPHHDLAPAAARAGRRLSWLDFFRGLAVLVMIETHVVNTFLDSALRASAWFPALNYLNGLVAPSFLFIAGFAQGLERSRSPRKPIPYRRRAGRLLGLAAIGYALHFPVVELAQHRWADALRAGTKLDILQCVALSLGLLLGVSWLAEKFESAELASCGVRRRRFLAALAGQSWRLGVVALAIAGIVGASLVAGWTGGPVPLRALINQTTGSLFPLLPWTAFVLLGALAGAWPTRPIHERAAGIIGLAVLAWACRGATFSAVSASFFLERAAWVLVLAILCEWSARAPLPRWMVFAGNHSLTFYVAHLVLIGALAGAGVPPAAFSPAWTAALLALVLAGSFAVALLRKRGAAGLFGEERAPAGARTAELPTT